MLRRAVVAASIAGAVVSVSGRSSAAGAAGAWIASASLTPTEQRIAVSVGPTRTTLWTSLRFDAAGSTAAIIVPAPPGSSLDFSSDAWFEALEVATAPRVFPPANISPYCPGKSGPATIFEIDGQVSHTQSLAPQDVAVLDDAAAVTAWAAQAGLVVSPALQSALAGLAGTRFVGVRLGALAGSNVTPTLRVAMPGAPPMLPLALTRASGEDLRVTAWIIGEGQADLIGATPVVIPHSSLSWKAFDKASNYGEARAAALSVDPGAFVVECASHEALSETVQVAGGKASIDGVMMTFFERAAAYGDGKFDAASCIASATPALASGSPVAASCPQAALGVVDPAPACSESPAPGTVDPGALRCGPGADDLAVALSGLVPAGAWVTRQSLQIAAGSGGVDWFLGFAGGGQPVSPVLVAASLDASGCADGGAPDGGSHTGSGPGSSSSGGTTTSGGHLVYGGSPDGAEIAGEVAGEVIDVIDAVASDTSCSCSNPDLSSSSSDSSCSSSDGSSDSSCSSSDGSSDSSCSSSDGSSDSSCSSSDGSSESCSGSSGGGESCSSGGGDSCSGGGGDFSGCSGSDFKCSTARPGRLRVPKFSILVLSAFAVAVPLRRRGRRERRARS
jgi:hypothetical protein